MPNNALDVSTMKSIIDNINIEKAKNSDLGHSPLFLKLADALVKKASDILKADSHSDEILRTEKGRYDLNKVAQYLTQKLPSFPAPEMAPQSADALSSSKIQAHTGP